jgi:hypothetical protein
MAAPMAAISLAFGTWDCEIPSEHVEAFVLHFA